MSQSHKPIIWGLFAAGGTLAAFVVPVLILITCLLSYDRLLGLLQHPFSKLVTFAILFLLIWHAAHRMRITAHDFGVRNDPLVMFICYGVAAAGSLLALFALLNI
jgi:fumarate reductase subunit D